MTQAKLTMTASGMGPVFARIAEVSGIARAPMAVLGPEMVKITRDQIDKEFDGGFFFNPSGGKTKWPAGHDFGTRKKPAKRLRGRQGRYAKAWQGGAGGSSRVTSRTFSVLAQMDGLEAHRGGLTARPRVGHVTRLRAKRTSRNGRDSAMRIYLGLEFGVWISDDKLRGPGLELKASAHAARHPEGTRLMVEAAERAFEAN